MNETLVTYRQTMPFCKIQMIHPGLKGKAAGWVVKEEEAVLRDMEIEETAARQVYDAIESKVETVNMGFESPTLTFLSRLFAGS